MHPSPEYDLSGTVSQLFIHPIKSCAGVAVAQALITPTGLQWDRAWMVVDAGGVFMTQREWPRMALIHPRLEADALRLQAPGMADLRLPLQPPAGAVRSVRVWRDTVAARSMGAQAAQWLTQFLGHPCDLVRFDAEQQRLASLDWTEGVAAPIEFADGFPLLVITQAALDDLNARLAAQGHAAVGMERFRPNLVVAGFEAHDEDRVEELHVQAEGGGEGGAAPLRLQPVKPCARCPIPDVNPASAEQGHAVGDALRAYRSDARVDGGITFGMNAIVHHGVGQWLRVGQRVQANLRFE